MGGFHHSSPGSSQGGYSCMQARMVAAWREIWAVSDGTTDPLAPFGLVTIAPSGSEGNGMYLSAFRWAQTANYGVLPNAAMPRTFVAQAYDLNDPWCASFATCPHEFARANLISSSVPNAAES